LSLKEIREVALDCFKHEAGAVLIYVLFMTLNLLLFWLYHLDLEPFLYGGIIIGVVGVIFIIAKTIHEVKCAESRKRLMGSVLAEWQDMPDAESASERDYQEMVRRMGAKISELALEYEHARRDSEDYYTTWAHQIKTPIAVIRMQLGNSESEENRAVLAELFRIEQYVDMVLQYIRLGSPTNDLVIQEYSLDELIRESLRKFAPQFIYRRLSLNYEGTDRKIVTDKKWFACILEQLLSNAVKYTPKGSVTVRVTDDGKLIVEDTGIGIRKCDIPRIFEKGYTGINGRSDRKSSGLGLYLCKQAADKLAVTISVASTPEVGSRFEVGLPPIDK
jgi:hypothetical protein